MSLADNWSDITLASRFLLMEDWIEPRRPTTVTVDSVTAFPFAFDEVLSLVVVDPATACGVATAADDRPEFVSIDAARA